MPEGERLSNNNYDLKKRGTYLLLCGLDHLGVVVSFLTESAIFSQIWD